jgi:hypothetical protein
MKHTTNPVIITAPSRMAVVAVFGNAKASIRNTGASPIAIVFICISVTCISDPLPVLLSGLRHQFVRPGTSYAFREPD